RSVHAGRDGAGQDPGDRQRGRPVRVRGDRLRLTTAKRGEPPAPGGAGGLSRVSRRGALGGFPAAAPRGTRSASWLVRRTGTGGGIVEWLVGQRAGVNLRAVVDDPAHGRRAARGLDAHAQLRSVRYPKRRAAESAVVL